MPHEQPNQTTSSDSLAGHTGFEHDGVLVDTVATDKVPPRHATESPSSCGYMSLFSPLHVYLPQLG